MAPANVVTPLSLMFRLRLVPSDLTVLPSVMPTPLKVVFAPKVNASPKVCAPVVRTLPPLINVLPPASVVKLLSCSPAVALPTAPSSVVVPLSLIVKLRFVPSDFTEPRVMPTPVNVVSAAKVTALL